MDILNILQRQFGQLVSLELIKPNIMRVYAPFFHEDGDMISMYLDINESTGNIRIRDFGNTLMRVSYTFDIDSVNKQNILSNIVKSNYGTLDDGELVIDADMDNLANAIFQYSQLVAKVSNIDILRNEVVKSLFYDHLNDFIFDAFKKYNVTEKFAPTNDKELVVDYHLPAAKPLYIFGVNKDTKASKVVISCLTFQKQHIPFRSLIIHEDFNGLSAFNRNQITNAADKQFASLDDFKAEGIEYVERELVS